jgi:hypothetical protein
MAQARQESCANLTTGETRHKVSVYHFAPFFALVLSFSFRALHEPYKQGH